MKKKIVALGTTIFGALAMSFTCLNVEAVSKDIVSKDEFVFNGNSYSENSVSAKKQIASNGTVTLTMGKSEGRIANANNFSYGDYSFDKAVYALTSNNTDPCYYVSAPEGTKIGMYYTLTSKEAKDNTYYVSNNSTIEVVKEEPKYINIFGYRFAFGTEYVVKQVYTEVGDMMYYSEFTFDDEGTIGLRAHDQYLFLFGLSVVTEEEITYRNQADIAIDNLLKYYEENGVSTSYEFEDLINKAKNSVKAVNHISQIDEYDKYVEVLNKYEELVKVEDSINSLIDNRANSLTVQTIIKYDAESKALLENVAKDIETANQNGISNDMISNYDVYLAAVAKYNALEEDNKNALAAIDAILALGDVTYTNEYKNALDNVSNLLDKVNNLDLVSNYDDFVAKKNAFNELSNNAKDAFVEKVNEASAVKGEADSYVLFNEAYDLYNGLIDADKSAVVDSYNALIDVENAYSEYESNVTSNDAVCSYTEDGDVYKVLFIGTIENFTCVEDIKRIVIVLNNETTGEKEVSNITKVYTAVKLSGVYVKNAYDNVRYIYTKIVNENNIYSGNKFSMYFSVEYKDGHLTTSHVFNYEV